jgi:hypothetical protein
MSKIIFTIIACLFCLNAGAQSGFSVTGTVRDNKGELLPGATVFLSNTQSITATDKDGVFKLKGISPGTYVLVVKFIGYQTMSTAINVMDKSIDVNVILKESANHLNQVTINADPRWEEHFQEFKKRFLGETPNANKCRIENKEVLHFRFNAKTETLTATADEFLKIKNDALGYEINYLLESFEFNVKTGILKYQGYPSFRDLPPTDEKQAKLWQKNRNDAYAGSPTHLMKAIFDGDSYKQGFRIYSCNYDAVNPYTDDGQEKQLLVFSDHQILLDSLITQAENNMKLLSFKRSLFVVYAKGKETFHYKHSGYSFKRPMGISMIPYGQLSIISLLDNDVTLDQRGNFSLPDALLFKGFMAWRQIADLTPLEYTFVNAARDE